MKRFFTEGNKGNKDVCLKSASAMKTSDYNVTFSIAAKNTKIAKNYDCEKQT